MRPSKRKPGTGVVPGGSRARRSSGIAVTEHGPPTTSGRNPAHELRNRVAAIANAVYYLKLVAPPDDRVRTYLDILEREVRAVSGLIGPFTGTVAKAPPADRLEMGE